MSLSNRANVVPINNFFKVDRIPHTNGSCQLSWEDGSVFSGEFDNGAINGFGLYQFPDGASYEGFWNNNCKHGTGVMFYANGDKFQGEFRNDSPNGKGIFYSLNELEPFIYIPPLSCSALFPETVRVSKVALQELQYMPPA